MKEVKNKNEEVKNDTDVNNPVIVQPKPPAARVASGLGGLVPAGGRIKKAAAKQVAKII